MTAASWNLQHRCLLAGILLLGSLGPGALGAQDIGTVAGNGTAGYSGDGGPATSASLRGPIGVAADAAGNLYIGDTENFTVRKVTPAGVISTFAGTGSYGFSGDGGPATSAELDFVGMVDVDAAGNVYIADYSNGRIRKVTPAGTIFTVAGTGGYGFSGDGGAATSATFRFPIAIAVAANGEIYISDWLNDRVRKVAVNGVITTVAGNGIRGFAGDGGLAVNASLNQPNGLTLDAAGNLYIADRRNFRVRRVSAATGIITTVAGNGVAGFSGDGGSPTLASLRGPWDVKFDSTGNLYISDLENRRVRVVSPGGVISTYAGDGTIGFSGDGGPATLAQVGYPAGLATRGADLFIVDSNNNRVRKVSGSDSTPPQVTPIIVGTLGNNGWYRGNVTVGWDVFDAESSIESSTGCGNSSITTDTNGVTLSCTATSVGGSNTQSVTIRRDQTPPSLAPSLVNSYGFDVSLLNGSGSAQAGAADALSGVASQSCAALNTATVGSKTVLCSAADNAGNVASTTFVYRVIYRVEGLTPNYWGDLPRLPVNRALNFRWRLTDANGAPVDTLVGASVVAVGPNYCPWLSRYIYIFPDGTGNTTLQRLGDGHYSLSWRAPKSYKGFCARVGVRLDDGQQPMHRYRFD